MLLLTRKIGESIIIDGGITITVTDIKGGQIKIGVDAPKEVKVYREEIHEKMKRKKLSDCPYRQYLTSKLPLYKSSDPK